ncbi:hypothetical protein [Marinobacter sp.]|uniref:hypothetical protein n=1 Tax=Marinobacter sp. TaxID=50741 RepID=UPI003A95A46F
MPYSGSQSKVSSGAIVPVIWYLLNLLALPVFGFAVLVWLFTGSDQAPALRRAHTRAAVFMSMIGAVAIFSGVAVFWLLFGNTGNFWTGAIVWAIVLHTSFVLWGIISLAQAVSDKPPYFPRRFL